MLRYNFVFPIFHHTNNAIPFSVSKSSSIAAKPTQTPDVVVVICCRPGMTCEILVELNLQNRTAATRTGYLLLVSLGKVSFIIFIFLS